MARDPSELLPLKPVIFHILLALAEGERHGWSLVHALQQRTGGDRLLPGNLYRLLKAAVREGLVEEIEPSPALRERAVAATGANADRRRYLQLTPFGREVARAEARRLEALVTESRSKKLLARPRS